MKQLKKLTMILALAFTGVLASWAQDEYVTVDPTANANEWTLEMPAADVELEVTYYTDEELAAEEEAAFAAGVELTKVANGEWTLTEMPGFDIELEVEYETALALNEVDDNTATLAEWDKCEADVTLTRTLQQGGWNTFCVPFDLATPNGWTVKELTGSTFAAGKLTLTFGDAASIVAGKPYLVQVTDAAPNPTFEGVTIANGMTTTTSDYADFVPVMSPTNLPGGDKNVLFVTGGNKLTYPSADGNINGFRAYFQLKGDAAAARSFAMSFDGATGIENIEHGTLNIDHSVYDLQGRRMVNGQWSMVNGQSPKKGVYIVNGKKVIIK